MKLRRRMASQVPPKIKSFINSVTAVPLDQIQEPLSCFHWDFDKGDFHHWVDLFNHFDTYFEKHVKGRKDLHVEQDFEEESTPPFPRDALLQILRVIRVVLENCTNKHFYTSYVQHLSLLLASTDADVVEACLQTLTAFLKRQIGKYSIKDASLNSKLFSLAQGWGGKEEGLGLTSCATENTCDQVSHHLGCTLHFEFYASNESSSELPGGLQVIHVPDVSLRPESDLELLNKLVIDHNVPSSLRFALLTRLRFARAFSSLSTRLQYTRIRLYAFIVLVQASGDTQNVASFFSGEPGFVNELVTLVSYEDTVPEKIRILCLLSLVALSQDRSRQTTVLTAVTSGGHRDLLSGLMQKAIDSVIRNTSKWSLAFAEALLSLVTVFVSSSSGCSAMREAGLIPILVPLIKDTDPQHLHLVSTAVHILEAFMDYSNPAAALFRDLGGLDDTIFRLKLEVSRTEDDVNEKNCGSDSNGRDSHVLGGSLNRPDTEQLPYSEALISYHRRLLLKALLCAISLGTYAPGNTNLYGSEESLLPECLCIIFQRAKYFGGGVFSLAATVMSDLIHKDPTCFNALDSAGVTSAFLDAISDEVICSAEAITCIPQSLDALCLNNSGLQAVKDRNALRCFVKIFTSSSYLRALTGDTPSALSSGLDELLRHQSSLRTYGVDMFIEILQSMLIIGSGMEASTSVSADVTTDAAASPMDIDADEKSSDEAEPSSASSPANAELFLPDCVCNVARLFETVLQNAEVCSLFVEKKGIDAVLKLLSLPIMPLSTSLGQSFSVAFKNFSPQHSASLSRTVCSYLQAHVKSTNELFGTIKGTQLLKLESAVQMAILRSLSCLESMLSLSNFLLKGTSSVIAELSAADADVLKELGLTYEQIIWQMALSSETKEDEKKSVDRGPDNSVSASSSTVERQSDEDSSNASAVRYTNPVSIRSSTSQSIWRGGRDILSVMRSVESIHGRARQAIPRTRGGRTRRHLEPFNFDSEISPDLPETSSTHELKKKSTEVLTVETLDKLNCTLRLFFTALVKGSTSANRRRTDGAPLSSASKTLGNALAKVFLEALNFDGHGVTAGHDIFLSVKCRYLGRVVDDMASLTFDTRRRVCFTAMINSFYVHGTFKQLLTTFEATSQLLWTVPFSVTASGTENEHPGERNIWSRRTWLVDTLQIYCRALDYFVNSTFLLSPAPTSQTQLLVQQEQASIGLSIELHPVPREPETFVRNLQSQVLDVILPIWNHPMFPDCDPNFVASVTSLVTHIYSGVVDATQNQTRGTNQRALPLQPDETIVGMIVEMGFSRSRAEDALRRVGTNSVEMAMEWLFANPEHTVQEDDELAQALALSLGNASETPKPVDAPLEAADPKEPSVDEVIAASVKLFQSGDSMAFPLMDLFVTLCSRNKGEDRPKITSYLIQQLKLVQLDFSKDTGALTMLPHILALVLSEDDNTREIAAQDGIVTVAIDILTNFKLKSESESEILAPKCISALLLILSMMLQARTRISSEFVEGNQGGSLEPSDYPQDSAAALKKVLSSDVAKGESNPALESVFGKSTGYLTMEEGQKALLIACALIKQCVPEMIMQAVLQLCARLTKTHALAIQFLENGGLSSLFNLPKKCFFPGYDTVASVIVRHLVEDPQTLQIAMESEIRQTLSGKRHVGRILPRTFLTTMAPVISRDPVVFMKAVASTCQLESSGGRDFVIPLKEKEKPKVSSSEQGLSLNEPLGISENKLHDGSGKCSKSHRRVPANFIQVIDQLIDILLSFPRVKRQEDDETNLISMEVDEPATKVKGKSKVGDPEEAEFGSEESEELARVTFILKLLSDIVIMYLHGTSVILRRDTEISQLRGSNLPDNSPGSGGLIYHVIHRLLPISLEKSVGSEDWKEKLSEKASWFLVVFCCRSSEGRRRIISELSRVLSVLASLGKSSSSKSVLLPDKRVLAFAGLVYSILTKNSSSSNLPGCGCSPDVAKSMIDGGTIKCLTSILHVIDLDHPDAPKLVTLILKSLETLTRAANTAEQLKSEGPKETKGTDSNERHDSNGTSNEAEVDESNRNNSSLQQVTDAAENGQEQPQISSQSEGGRGSSQTQAIPQEMRIEGEETILPEPIPMDFMGEEIEGDQIEMSFHVENRAGDDGDDDMGDEEDDEEGFDDIGPELEDDEDADLVEDGAGGVMSLSGTDVEDPEDTGLGDEYNDDMIDEDEDDIHENRVIEVRWREALDGLDHFQILGRSGGGNGFIDDFTTEPFEGVNVGDLVTLQRPLGFERRLQTDRNSLHRSGSEVHGFRHPLFSRPLQTGNTASVSASAGSNDVSQFYMFDTPVLPFDQVPSNPFSDRLGGSGAPPPLTDYSVVDMDSSRRGVGDSRWTDIGHPQPSSQSASIAQLIEEHFISNLRTSAPADTVVERETNSTEVQEQQQSDVHPSVGSETVLGDGNDGGQQSEAHEMLNNDDNVNSPPDVTAGSFSQARANLASPELLQPLPLTSTPNEIDGMEVGEGDGVPIEQPDVEAVDLVSTAQGQLDTSSSQNVSGTGTPMPVNDPVSNCQPSEDVDMSSDGAEGNRSVEPSLLARDNNELSSMEATQDARNDEQVAEGSLELDGRAPEANSIDPTFLEALPEELRAEVLASQQAQSVQPPTYEPPSVEDIDPEFLAALPPDIQTEVLAQQRVQRMVQQSQGQPVDMDNASIIATLPADLREEVLLTSSEAVLAALPSPLLAEARMLRDRAMSHYQARSHSNRRNGLGYNRLTGMNRDVGVTIGQRDLSSSADGLKVKEMEGDPLVDAEALKSLIRLLRLAQPLGKGLLQRLLLNLCAHRFTRANLVQLLLDLIRPEMETSPSELAISNPQRLYGCQSNVVYGRSQLLNGLPPLVFRRVLEVLTYLATNHSAVADMLFCFDSSLVSQLSKPKPSVCEGKGKEKVTHVTDSRNLEIPLVVFLKLLNRPQLLQSTSHLALVMGLLQVVVYTAASRIEGWSPLSSLPEKSEEKPVGEEAPSETRKDAESELVDEADKLSVARSKNCADIYNIFLQLPQSDLCNLCILLGYEGLSDKIYLLAGEVLKKLAAVDVAHRKFFAKELSQLASGLSASTVRELATLSNTQKMSHSTGSMAGASILRVLQVLSSLTSASDDSNTETEKETEQEEQNIMHRLNMALEPLWQELSQCISITELQLDHTAATSTVSNVNPGDHALGVALPSPLSPGTQRFLPLIEAFFVLCEKIQTRSILQHQDHANVTAGEVKESAHSSSSKASVDSQEGIDGSITFAKFAEKHKRLLNSFVRQNPSLLEKSLSMMLKAPRLIDFDNKKAYFRSRIKHQHDQHISGPLRISVRRAYMLEDSYNQLRMRSLQDLRGRLNVQFQGEEGVDAGGLTREWYQLLSRVIFDKGALLFTTVGNDATFQPNPNSVYQNEHLSYFKFVGRMVAKALFDGQLLDVYFTRSFYKHILGVKVTYHDIEAVDPDYYKNLKWLLENDVSDILDLTFSMDADEEKHILYEKTEVTDYELKPGGRNIRVTEETKHEYVDLVAGHILTNAIRPQINAFLEGFNELIPRELVSIFNDKELELLISGLPEIDFDDLKANTEYTSYAAGSPVIRWFWEVVKDFSKEDMARFLQFVTGTSKVPLEGFKALQGISGPQRLQIHKAYGGPERLPSAHTCFNQLDLPEYPSKEQLKERLLLAIHEASEGFGFA
ncbi:hypothetical protein N665_1217s0015 [Sinapis alba]|nr:hypothetical protein N665_1217s0015 [Sinapis alba]